jgi:hypothetical protein
MPPTVPHVMPTTIHHVMPTKVGIHDLLSDCKRGRAWPAMAPERRAIRRIE